MSENVNEQLRQCQCEGCRLNRQAETTEELREELGRSKRETQQMGHLLGVARAERDAAKARNEQLERQDGEREDETAELRRRLVIAESAAPLKPAEDCTPIRVGGALAIEPMILWVRVR